MDNKKGYNSGEDFLDSIFPDMRSSEIVNHKTKVSDTPEDKIKKYRQRLERTHIDSKMDYIKKLYYKKYVITKLPVSYIQHQKRVAFEQGHGNITITQDMKKEMLKEIQDNQKKSLDKWLNYFTSKDCTYPTWFKVYCFQSMLKIGGYNKDKQVFARRTANTVDPYLDFDREILANVFDVVDKYILDKELNKEQKEALANGESFKRIYEYFLTKSNKEKLETTEGIWVKYEQGPNYLPLFESLQGKNTGWCTAGENVCCEQVKHGDFYVYYTKNKYGEYTNPRIAIRMDGKYRIGEVRGIAKDQNIEPEMLDIVDKKLDDFPDKKHYLKKVHDMKLLTEIYNKNKNKEELTKEEIEFLYEFYDEIEGFGWEKDPRIDIIRDSRDSIEDFKKLEIEVLDTAICKFDFSRVKDSSIFKKIRVIKGPLDLSSLKDAHGFENLEEIEGIVDFSGIRDSKGFEKLKVVKGIVDFSGLYNTDGLTGLEEIEGTCLFSRVKNVSGLSHLRTIKNNTSVVNKYLSYTIDEYDDNADELLFRSNELYDSICERCMNDLYIGFVLFDEREILGTAFFPDLEISKDLENLEVIEGDAIFLMARAIILPKLEFIGRDALFSELKVGKGLFNLKSIGGDAIFPELRTAKGMHKLESIGGSAIFPKLVYSIGLRRLKSIGHGYNFNRLISTFDFLSLESVDGKPMNRRMLQDKLGIDVDPREQRLLAEREAMKEKENEVLSDKVAKSKEALNKAIKNKKRGIV